MGKIPAGLAAWQRKHGRKAGITTSSTKKKSSPRKKTTKSSSSGSKVKTGNMPSGLKAYWAKKNAGK